MIDVNRFPVLQRTWALVVTEWYSDQESLLPRWPEALHELHQRYDDFRLAEAERALASLTEEDLLEFTTNSEDVDAAVIRERLRDAGHDMDDTDAVVNELYDIVGSL